MERDEPRSFEPEACGHTDIDHRDEAQLRYWAERLEATPDEVVEAVRAVGSNCTAVAIWLGSADAI